MLPHVTPPLAAGPQHLSYDEARRNLQAATVRQVRPGLERTRRLLAFLNHPDRIPGVQITGTNGKGSVTALVSAALQAGGYRVGRFTSPHLADERERIAVNGRIVSRPAFTAAVQQLLPFLKRLQAENDPATTFEAWTALAAWIFREQRVQIAVLEVGMGGRWDATSAWTNIILSILTHVGLDHTQELGATLAEICEEKLAISRPGVAFVSAERDPGLRRRIRQAASQAKFPLYFAGQPEDHAFAPAWRRTAAGLRLALEMHGRRFPLKVGMQGGFQVPNAVLAALAVDCLAASGFPVSDAGLRAGFETVRWSGRLEKLGDTPEVYVDGGHNPEAAAALAEEWRARKKQVVLVMGVMKDKDVSGMIQALAPVVRKVYTVRPPEPERALAAEDLASAWRTTGKPAQPRASFQAALAAAMHDAGVHGAVLVAGSLYNIAPARRAWRRLRLHGLRPRPILP